MKNFANDPDRNFESGADPAHASGVTPKEHSNAERPGKANPRGNRPDGAGRHAADARNATADARRTAEETKTGKKEKGGSLIPYKAAMDELFVHLEAQKLPKIVHALLGATLENPLKLFCWVGDAESATGANRVVPGLYASDLLVKLLLAVRALNWELAADILAHAVPPVECEITGEMIKAGLDVWYSHDREFDDAAEIVKEIFSSMRARQAVS